MRYNCLIIDKMHPSIVSLLQNIEVTPIFKPDILPEAVYAEIADYDGLIIRSKMYLDERFFAKASKLKFIARAGAGLDGIDQDAAQKRGIALLNAPKGNRDAVGEHTVGLMLCLLNKIHSADREVRQKMWRREAHRGRELGEMTVGIIGYGNMGQATAKRLSGFGCPKVIAYDKYKKNYGDKYAEQVNIQTIFAEADLVSFHIPLSKENMYWANAEFFGQFRKPIYLINTARGKVISLKTIADFLKKGVITGAALDVLENEKLLALNKTEAESFDFLSKSTQVLFTPHVAGWTFESYKKINTQMVAKIDNFLNKKRH